MNLLCTDKTGTITEGTITVAGLVDGSGVESGFVKQLAYWNASLEAGYSNPIDEALKQLKFDPKVTVTKLGEVPYDFIRKRLSIALSTGKEQLIISKGAFSQILSICTAIRLGNDSVEDIAAHREQLENNFAQYGTKGLRAIAVCYKPIPEDKISKDSETAMIFAGFVLMNDAVKSGITDTINALHQLKVGLKIITGDNKNVAQSIALDIGIKRPVIMTGKQLSKPVRKH
ncbi:MAG: HAD family hydrolase [Weeksellaceae bacterium]|nr:HAD family hydrolase [Weeksellaceae bacterium]